MSHHSFTFDRTVHEAATLESSAGASDLISILSAGSVSQIGRTLSTWVEVGTAISASMILSAITGDFLDSSRSSPRLGRCSDLQTAFADLLMAIYYGTGSQIVPSFIIKLKEQPRSCPSVKAWLMSALRV